VPPNSIVEYVRYVVAADRADALVASYRRALPVLEASPHCLAVELTRCHEDPGRFVLRLEWDSLAGHVEGFRKSDVFRAFVAEVGPFIDAIEEMAHYEPCDVAMRRPETLYDAVGGVGTFFAIAGAMHHEMSSDARLGDRFRRAAPTHVPHLAMWLTEVFGGPKLYSETLGDIAPILARHAGGDFTDDDRERFVELTRRAAERHIPASQPRALDAFMRYIEWGARVAVANSRPDHVPNAAAGVPTWSWDTQG